MGPILDCFAMVQDSINHIGQKKSSPILGEKCEPGLKSPSDAKAINFKYLDLFSYLVPDMDDA